MQSQQKKVKWSRGETADALEERTDTGITQVSVSKMENIIADIYGNISRRPAFKIIENAYGSKEYPIVSWINPPAVIDFVNPPQSFVFTIDESSYIIFIVPFTNPNSYQGLLIQDGKFVKRVKITNNTGLGSAAFGKQISAAQYNNFMVVSNLYGADVILRLDADNNIIVEKFQFSAPWYAPGGTQTKTVSDADITGLEFNKDGNGFKAFAWTDTSGNSSPYSTIDTGLTGDVQPIEEAIPVGSIVKFPNLGAYMRVEGYQISGTSIYFVDTIFDGVINAGGTIPSSGSYARCTYNGITEINYLEKYVDGTLIETIHISKNATIWVQNDASVSGYSQWNRGTQTWSDVPSGSLNVLMFGALLTPVAAANEKDTTVTVEYGYISLNEYQPTKFTFSQQRLYAAGFENQDAAQKQIPGYAVGSQIAKYNDFKNDFNTASEAVVIDISTSYQEQIVSMIDYNGLKIFTDSAEYNVANGAPVKQSENGSLSTCKPIVFGSVCLYADKSGQQIRALQYELQTDIFASSSINQLSKEDLIFNTTSMTGFLDKENCTGRFLFTTQFGYNRPDIYTDTPKANHSIAVCNMVPGNQAMIWSRWTSPKLVYPNTGAGDVIRHTIPLAIEVNNKVWFIMACYIQYELGGFVYTNPGYTLAELDYSSTMDAESTANAADTKYFLIKSKSNENFYAWKDNGTPSLIIYTKSATPVANDPIYDKYGAQLTGQVNSLSLDTLTYTYLGSTRTATRAPEYNILNRWATMPGATVSVFDGDEYKWDDTLDANGNYTKSLASLAHPRVGFKINAELVSHPIDVGGRTYTDHKRIGKCVAVVRDTEAGAFTICNKTGYMDNDKKKVNFYGCTGMKDEVRYTIKNINGAKFTIESLTMIIEYATLDS